MDCKAAAEALENQQEMIRLAEEAMITQGRAYADLAAGFTKMEAESARLQAELGQAKAERDEYFEQLRGLCFCCGHKTDGFDCQAKCYGHKRGTAWIYGGPQKEE